MHRLIWMQKQPACRLKNAVARRKKERPQFHTMSQSFPTKTKISLLEISMRLCILLYRIVRETTQYCALLYKKIQTKLETQSTTL